MEGNYWNGIHKGFPAQKYVALYQGSPIITWQTGRSEPLKCCDMDAPIGGGGRPWEKHLPRPHVSPLTCIYGKDSEGLYLHTLTPIQVLIHFGRQTMSSLFRNVGALLSTHTEQKETIVSWDNYLPNFTWVRFGYLDKLRQTVSLNWFPAPSWEQLQF